MLGHRSYYFMFIIPALALLACGGDKPIDETTGAVEEAIPVGGHLAGTYTSNTHQAGDFSQLVLKTDGTYHARVFVVCVTTPCRDIEQDGHYTLFRRESLTYFQTYDRPGLVTGRYQYMLRGDTLNLRKVGSTNTFTPMARSPTAWCAMSHDCALQELPIGPCAGQYACTTVNTCNWQCGAAPEIAIDGQKPRTGG